MSPDAPFPGTLVGVSISRWIFVAALIYVATLKEGAPALRWRSLSVVCTAFVQSLNLVIAGTGAQRPAFPRSSASSGWGVLKVTGTLGWAKRGVGWPYWAAPSALLPAWAHVSSRGLPFDRQALASALLAAVGAVGAGVRRRATRTPVHEYRVLGAPFPARGVLLPA